MKKTYYSFILAKKTLSVKSILTIFKIVSIKKILIDFTGFWLLFRLFWAISQQRLTDSIEILEKLGIDGESALLIITALNQGIRGRTAV